MNAARRCLKFFAAPLVLAVSFNPPAVGAPPESAPANVTTSAVLADSPARENAPPLDLSPYDLKPASKKS